MANITKRISRKGVVSYRIKVSLGYDSNHKQITKSMTWTPDANMTEKQIQKALEKQAFLFENSLEHNPKISRRVKFGELSEEWIALMENTGEIKRSTLERMKDHRKRIYTVFGNSYIDDISHRAIQQFIISLSKPGTNKSNKNGLSEKTQKHYLTFISDIMRYAIKCEIISTNPCKDISVVKTQKKKREVYSIEEEGHLLDLLRQQNVDMKYRAFFALVIYCGLRRGEALGLEWKDIDFTSGMISIVRVSQYRNKNTGMYTDSPKTENSIRYIMVPKDVLDELLMLKEELAIQKANCGDQWIETDRLFVKWNGEPMFPNTPYRYLKSFCEKNGLEFKGIHSFRHAFATNLITSNAVDIKTVSSLLGHSQTSTTLNIYTHEVKKANAKGMDVMADLIRNAVNNDQK